MTEPKAMQEIHEIREKIYEETKHLSQKEKNERYKRIMQKYKDEGFIIANSVN